MPSAGTINSQNRIASDAGDLDHPLLRVSARRAADDRRQPFREHYEMWPYVQMWFPLLTVALTAAICFAVVSFIMGQGRIHR
jgi:hypothetical protein